MGKADVKGVDLYDGGTGDIRSRLSVSEMREKATGLSARVGEISKSFEDLVRASGCLTNELLFAARACVKSRVTAGRGDRSDNRELSLS